MCLRSLVKTAMMFDLKLKNGILVRSVRPDIEMREEKGARFWLGKWATRMDCQEMPWAQPASSPQADQAGDLGLTTRGLCAL